VRIRVFRSREDAWVALHPYVAADEKAEALGWIVPRRRWLAILVVELATGIPLVGAIFDLVALILWLRSYQTIYAFCLTDRRLLMAPARYPWQLVITGELQAVPREAVWCAFYRENPLHSYLDLVIQGVRSDWVLGRRFRSDARLLGALRAASPAV
jgi:hypothetical protein